jgi:hypothetical protein
MYSTSQTSRQKSSSVGDLEEHMAQILLDL